MWLQLLSLTLEHWAFQTIPLLPLALGGLLGGHPTARQATCRRHAAAPGPLLCPGIAAETRASELCPQAQWLLNEYNVGCARGHSEVLGTGHLLSRSSGNPLLKGSREGVWSLRTQGSRGPFYLCVDHSRLKARQERKTRQGDKKRQNQRKQKVTEQRTESPRGLTGLRQGLPPSQMDI